VRGEGQTFLVHFDEVVTIGADALMVRSSQVTQAAASGGEFGQLVDLGALKQLQVVDTAGTLLGTVRDVELDDTSGHARRLVVHKGGLLGFGGETMTVEATAIRGVSAQMITVGAVETPPTT
jgi:sporulation protein YlmC with PRC-barrel domain